MIHYIDEFTQFDLSDHIRYDSHYDVAINRSDVTCPKCQQRYPALIEMNFWWALLFVLFVVMCAFCVWTFANG